MSLLNSLTVRLGFKFHKGSVPLTELLHECVQRFTHIFCDTNLPTDAVGSSYFKIPFSAGSTDFHEAVVLQVFSRSNSACVVNTRNL